MTNIDISNSQPGRILIKISVKVVILNVTSKVSKAKPDTVQQMHSITTQHNLVYIYVYQVYMYSMTAMRRAGVLTLKIALKENL